MKESVVNAVLYTRIANAKQRIINSEINSQELSLRKYCETKAYNVLRVFNEIGSRQQLNCPELNNLYEYIASANGQIHKVVLTTWDRCSRDIEKTILVINKLKSMGVDVQTSNQDSKISSSEHGFILSVYMAQFELQQRSERIKMGIKRKQDGRKN